NTGGTTLSGQVTGAAGLTKQGAGTLFLSNAVGAASNYTGQTTVTGGILNASNGQPGTSAPLGGSLNVVVAAGAALQTQNPAWATRTINRPLFLNGSGVGGNGALENVFGPVSVTGAIALNTSTTFGVDGGTLTQATGVVSGPGDLTKVGPGTLFLQGANTFTGQTTINNGIVQALTSAFPLGAVIGTVVVNTGATLSSSNPNAILGPRTLILNGTGFAGANFPGAFLASTNTNAYQGNIIINPGATIGVNAGVTL